jgi:histidinol dehydrogenase
MKIKTKKTIEVEQDLIVPSFFKNGNITIAIINDETFIRIFKLKEHVIISYGNPETFVYEINNAVSIFSSITEQEFFDYYQEVLESISLQPKLIS